MASKDKESKSSEKKSGSISVGKDSKMKEAGKGSDGNISGKLNKDSSSSEKEVSGAESKDDKKGALDFNALQKEDEELLRKETWYNEGLSFIVLGASGDLAKKKTFPALFSLFCARTFHDKFTCVCGYARSKKSDEEFKKDLRSTLIKDGKTHHKEIPKKELEKRVDEFLNLCIYRSGKYDSVDDLGKIMDEVGKMSTRKGAKKENRVFYFAIPPDIYVTAAAVIKKVGLSETGFNRLVIEKPFGHDTESALELGKRLNELFTEDHLYRIDHFLGKEMMQNLILLRFANAFLEPIWNRHHVKAVLISFKEDFGTEGRAGYFDKAGIIRDMMQNHMLQALSMIAMERPAQAPKGAFSNFVRDEKVKVLRSIAPLELKDVVVGQFTGNPDSKKPGYLEDDTVEKGSLTPTFCTAVFHINNDRWQGVPFILKVGKALDQTLVTSFSFCL
jgi:glucose-6-phosphate 1-dehydrogenase